MKLGVSGPEFVCIQIPAGTTEEGMVLDIIGRRLMRGYQQYGDLSKAKQDRDWTEEALEEILDGMVYVAKKLIEVRKQSAVLADAERPTQREIPDTAEDGREVHSVRPGEATREEDGSGKTLAW